MRNGGNSLFSFTLQDSHYALVHKIRIFALDFFFLITVVTMHPMNTQNPKGKVLNINEYTAFKRYSLAHHPHTYIQFGSKLTLGSNKICTAANWASSFLCQLYSPSNCSLLKTDPMFIMK